MKKKAEKSFDTRKNPPILRLSLAIGRIIPFSFPLMKTSVNFSQFVDAFRLMNRENNFSYDGLRALYDYLEDYEEQTGAEVSLDVIALCCKYVEYENFEEFKKDYSDIENFDELEWKTTVIYTSLQQDEESPFIIANF